MPALIGINLSMNTRKQIFIDNYLVRPVVWALNFLVRLVGKILRPDHNLDKSFKTIVVSKYKGMGSIIQATPLLQTLKENHPDAKIVFVSSKANAVFLSHLSSIIDRIIILDDRSLFALITSFPGFIISLIRLRAGLWIDLEIYSHAASLIATLSLATNRFGFYLRTSQYRMGVYTHMMFYNVNAPIAQTYLQMARRLGCKKIITELFSLESSQSIPEFIGNKKTIVINPNASDLRIERRWPASSYIALIEKLIQRFPDKKIVLLGSPGEAAYVKSIVKKIKSGNQLLDLSGKTSIGQLINIIKSAELMISNDSGPMHIGFSVDVAMIALFGPCHPQQYGQLKNARIFYHPLYCSPCVHEFDQAPCKGNNLCMQLIQVDPVFDACVQMLTGKQVINSDFQPPEFKYTVKAGAVFGNFDRD